MTLHGLNRYHAFAIHMAISLVIFFILLVCITQYWYPGILFDTGNGWKAVGLIVGIDLILGPLLTLVVFNPKKSSIKFDLWVIALIQIAALVYGTWTIHNSRPLAIAYINTSFMTLYANADNASEVKERVNSLKTRQLFYVFNDENPGKSFNTEQLAPYSQYAKTLSSINSPYHLPTADDSAVLIQIDPLASANRFLQVNKETGDIIKFFKKPSVPHNKSDDAHDANTSTENESQ